MPFVRERGVVRICSAERQAFDTPAFDQAVLNASDFGVAVVLCAGLGVAYCYIECMQLWGSEHGNVQVFDFKNPSVGYSDFEFNLWASLEKTREGS